MKPHNGNDQIPRKIIIIDDNPGIHEDFKTILSRRNGNPQLESLENELFGYSNSKEYDSVNFQLGFALQGQEGIEEVRQAVAEKQPYQLAFIDMRMPPGLNGLLTTQEIWKIDPDIQIVLCTAFSDFSWEEINKHLGVTNNLLILKKPFDSNEIAQMALTLTQKWHLAKQAKIKHDELENKVNQRTSELHKSNQALTLEITQRKELEEQLVRSQKMEAIGTLAASVAHDLNNILSGVLSYPDLLLKNIEEDDPLHRPLTLIRRSGHKAAIIVQDMLTLARRNVIIREPLKLNTIVNDFMDSPEYYSIREHHPNIQVEITGETDLPLVAGSAVHLEKLVMNLANNGAESMGENGTITIDLRSVQLSEPFAAYDTVTPGTYVKMTVTDQGTGIAPEDLKRVFEPFFTKKSLGYSGTGLGMTVVWDTVQQHDGYIDIQSLPTQGTVIAVYLPISAEQSSNTHTYTIQEDLKGNGQRVLVVDDVKDQREIAEAIFQELGYTVHTVPSGEMALKFIQAQPVELMLLDMIMKPGIDGLETLQRVLKLFPNQKAVIASGYTKNERVQKALQLGAGYIHKPYQVEDLAKTVRHVLVDQKNG